MTVVSSKETHGERFKSLNFLIVDCKILSLQLHSSEPYLWACREFSGYCNEQKLPYYRILPCHCRGTFCNIKTGRCYEDDISSDSFDEKDRGAISCFQARNPITDYIQVPQSLKIYQPHLLSAYGKDLFPGFICENIWLELEDDFSRYLMMGIRHVLSSFLLQAYQQNKINRELEGKGCNAWDYTNQRAQTVSLKHLELGSKDW